MNTSVSLLCSLSPYGNGKEQTKGRDRLDGRQNNSIRTETTAPRRTRAPASSTGIAISSAGIARTMPARASIRRCQGSPRRHRRKPSERPEGGVAAEGDAVEQGLPGRREAGERLPAGRPDDLVAAGDEASHRLGGEEVAGARMQPRPAGAAERAGEAGAVLDPDRLAVAERVELPQRPPGAPRLADDAEAAALAAPHRPVDPALLPDPAEERLAAGGAGRVVRAGAGLEGNDGVGALDLVHARVAYASCASARS